MKSLTKYRLSFLWIFVFTILTLKAQKIYQTKIGDPITESWRWTYVSKLHGKNIRCTSQCLNGDMLFGIDMGLMKYNGIKWEFFSPKDTTLELTINNLCDGGDGATYVGTNSGLYSVKNNEWTVKADNDFSDVYAHFVFAYMQGHKINNLTIEDLPNEMEFERRLIWGYDIHDVTIRNFSNRFKIPKQKLPQLHFRESSSIEINAFSPTTTNSYFLTLEGANKNVLMDNNNNNFQKVPKLIS